MKSLILLTLALCMASFTMNAQIYIDPLVAGATTAHAGVINRQLNRTNENLTLIQRGQLAVTGQLMIVNDIQRRLYKGLTEVSHAVKSLMAVKDIAEISVDITRQVQKAIDIAGSNPALLLFAEEGAREFRSRALKLSADVSAFVLKGGKENLMDPGERAKLLNSIREELIIIRGVAYGMHRSMFWAKQRGILNALNPYSGFVNIDKQIAEDIIGNSKLIRP